MRILVTGHKGFIGSHLYESLSGINTYDVIGMDKGDPFPSGNIDYIYHLAAIPGVRKSFDCFGDYCDSNLKLTYDLLNFYKLFKSLKKIIIASSSSVYGEFQWTDKNFGVRENAHRTIDDYVESPYALTKLGQEHLGYMFHKKYDIPINIMRFFTVYGPRQRTDMFFYKAIQAILEDREVTVFGDGNQVRDFTYIDDILDGLVGALKPTIKWEIFNLGSGKRTTINEALKALSILTGKKFKINYIDKQSGDVSYTYADINNAKNKLGYTPYVNLVHGLVKQYQWQKGIFNEKSSANNNTEVAK